MRRHQLSGLLFTAICVVALAPPDAARADWPTHRFETKLDESMDDQPPPAADTRELLEEQALRASVYFDSVGFDEPMMNGRFFQLPQDKYQIWLYATAQDFDGNGGSGDIAAYKHAQCVEILPDLDGLSYIMVAQDKIASNRSVPEIHSILAQEVNHGIQFNSALTQSCDESRWLREATAVGAALISTDNYFKIRDFDSVIGGFARSYKTPFRPRAQSYEKTPAAFLQTGYDAGLFFYWLGLRYGGAKYLAELYNNPYALLPGDDKTDSDIAWIDEGLAKSADVATGFDFLFPQFIADYGSWGHNYLNTQSLRTELNTPEKWRDFAFGGSCREGTLTNEEPVIGFSVKLKRLSAKCIKIHFDANLPEDVEIDVFAFATGEEQTAKLDGLHLSVVERRTKEGAVEACEDYSRSLSNRVWPACVLKPFLLERGDATPADDKSKLTRYYDTAKKILGPDNPALGAPPGDTTHLRLWNSADYIHIGSGSTTVYALSNAAPVATSTADQEVIFVVGVRQAKADGGAMRLGPPTRDSLDKLPPGLGETIERFGALETDNMGAANIMRASVASAGALSSETNQGYALYGLSEKADFLDESLVSLAVPRRGASGEDIGSYAVFLSNLPGLGNLGTADAIVTYTDGNKFTAFQGVCGDSNAEGARAQFLRADKFAATFKISTPMMYIDLESPQPECKQWDPFNVEFTFPMGWIFDPDKNPRDIVTPGLHAYVERYLASLRSKGLFAPDIGPFPGLEREVAITGGAGDAPNSQSGGAAVDQCDCSCAGINKLMESMQQSGGGNTSLPAMANCLQQCAPQLVQCQTGAQ